MRVVHVRRARGWFWGLTGVAILAAGALTHALTLDPGPAAGLQVAGSGLLLAGSATLATRVLLALTGAGSESARAAVQQRLSRGVEAGVPGWRRGRPRSDD